MAVVGSGSNRGALYLTALLPFVRWSLLNIFWLYFFWLCIFSKWLKVDHVLGGCGINALASKVWCTVLSGPTSTSSSAAFRFP